MITPVRDWIRRNIQDRPLFYLLLTIVAGFSGIYLFGEMLAPVLVAVVISYLLEGIILQFMRLKVPRIAAVTIVFVVYLVVFAIAGIWLGPLLYRQIAQLFQQLPAMLGKAKTLLDTLPENYPELVTASQVQEVYAFISDALSDFGKQVLAVSISSVKGVATFTVYIFLVPFLVFFLLKDKEKIIEWLARYSPPKNRLAASVLEAVNKQVANYIRGKAWEVFLIWGATWLVYHMIGVQYALLLSFLSGISVILPYIGVTFVFFPTLLIAFFQYGWDPMMLYTLAGYGIVQLLDGLLLAPILLSEVVNIHPVCIVICILFFGGLWGFWGVFFAIPLATLVEVLLETWVQRQARETAGLAHPSLAK